MSRARNLSDITIITEDNGNIGIGTDTPQAPLHISGDTPVLRIHANNESLSPNPKLELMRGNHTTFGADAYTDWRVEVQNDARFKISSHDVSRGENLRLVINHDTGNVNIGTDISPAYKLNVQGDLRATGTIYTNTDDIRGEGSHTGLLVGDVSGSYASGYGYVELHAQDNKWNQLLHYHGGTGSGSNMWRVGSHYNSSSGENYYRFYGRGNTNKNMLKLDAANDKIELESPMIYPSTSTVTSQSHQVNAGPWHHIQSWSITADTGTPVYFNDVFNNTDYISYKVYIHHWMSPTDGDEVYIRLLTGTNTPWALNYHYTALHHIDFSGTHSTTTYSSTNEARIWEGNWSNTGYGGIDGELTFTNVSSTTIDGRNVDRGTGAYRPNMLSEVCGYSVSGAGGVNSYRRTTGYNRFNVGNNSSYWKGFSIYNSGNNTVKAGASLSIYGLRPAL